LNWKAWRFLQLLIFMLLVLLLNPLEIDHPILMVIMQMLILNGILVSLSAAGFPMRMRGVLFMAWLACLGLDVASRVVTDAEISVGLALSYRAGIMFLLSGCVIAMLRYVLMNERVTTDSISAAIVAYLFIGLAFASAYYCLVVLEPRSFSIPADMPAAQGTQLETTMIYYSYVTLATLGYGDISPRLPVSQMLAAVEAIIGQFYIAVVIAWLMSVYAADRSRTRRQERSDE